MITSKTMLEKLSITGGQRAELTEVFLTENTEEEMEEAKKRLIELIEGARSH